jgi:ubiquinone/menaquinone biosynthesis C-methylase UbiE
MESLVYDGVHQVERAHWFFVARRRIIASLLERFFRRSDRAMILDIGGGTGGLAKVMSRFGSVVGLDYSEEALSYYFQRHPVVCQGDATHLPFGSSTLDFILALDILEHLEDDANGLDEFYRVLKPGGQALLTVPAFRFLWGRLDDVAHHYRRYTRQELVLKAEQSGLQVIKASYMNTILFPLVALARRTESLRMRWTKPDADLRIPPAWLNTLLTNLFGIESLWLRRLDLPLGVSVVCVLEK